ncbi:MAG: anti-sigma factor RsiW [Neolewinella sp.]|jgi:anti-sigma factor RsiW
MDQIFTQNDMVAYLYGESTPAQMNTTEAALAADPVLRGELAELTQAQASVPKVRFNARRRLLSAIRSYAMGPDLQLSL